MKINFGIIECRRKMLVIPDDNSILGDLVSKFNLGYKFQNKKEIKLFILEKIKEKQKNTLDTKLYKNDNLNFFKRFHQAKKFSSTLLEL